MFIITPSGFGRNIGGFIFTVVQSLILPVIFIVKNEKILQHTNNLFYENILSRGLHLTLMPLLFVIVNVIIGTSL